MFAVKDADPNQLVVVRHDFIITTLFKFSFAKIYWQSFSRTSGTT